MLVRNKRLTIVSYALSAISFTAALLAYFVDSLDIAVTGGFVLLGGLGALVCAVVARNIPAIIVSVFAVLSPATILIAVVLTVGFAP